MEDLIATYPDDFFPRHLLRLQGRQKTFHGIGRFDLHFLDQFESNILMELKAVPARYEDASQLAKYRDAMQAQGDNRIIMWLVAPLIPSSVREFLSHIGIEFTEIHESEFKRIAALRGFDFEAKAAIDKQLAPTISQPTLELKTTATSTDTKRMSGSNAAWHFNTDESEISGSTSRMIENSCFALWGYGDTERKMNAPIHGEPILFYRSKVGVVGSAYVGAEPATSSNQIFGKQTEQEFSRAVTNLIWVPNEAAVSAAELRNLGIKGPLLGGLCRRYPMEVAEVVREKLEAKMNPSI